jgi:hypothetical protein
VSSETVLSVIAPVGVANVVWVLNTADASIASLDLDHEISLIDGLGVLLLLSLEAGVADFVDILSLLLHVATVASVVVRSLLNLVVISRRVLAVLNNGVLNSAL